jgi:hypothetical protein
VGQLGEKQQQVLQRATDLTASESCTLEEIARDLNLTRERVRQIQIEALDQLRRIIRRGGGRATTCSSASRASRLWRTSRSASASWKTDIA